MDKQEDLKNKCVAFVMTMASAGTSDRDTLMPGIEALLALFTVNGDAGGVQKGVERLRKLAS